MRPTPPSSTLFVHLNQIRTEPARGDLEDFRTFYELADRLIAEAPKESVAEAAQMRT